MGAAGWESVSRICFSEEDIGREYRRLKEAGVEFLPNPESIALELLQSL
ncbi:VOC family protein [Flavonifractor porci]